jgi:hypothetical protein
MAVWMNVKGDIDHHEGRIADGCLSDYLTGEQLVVS